MAAGTFALIGGFLAAAGLPGLVATILGLPGWATLAAIVGIVRVAAIIVCAGFIVWGLIGNSQAAANRFGKPVG